MRIFDFDRITTSWQFFCHLLINWCQHRHKIVLERVCQTWLVHITTKQKRIFQGCTYLCSAHLMHLILSSYWYDCVIASVSQLIVRVDILYILKSLVFLLYVLQRKPLIRPGEFCPRLPRIIRVHTSTCFGFSSIGSCMWICLTSGEAQAHATSPQWPQAYVRGHPPWSLGESGAVLSWSMFERVLHDDNNHGCWPIKSWHLLILELTVPTLWNVKKHLDDWLFYCVPMSISVLTN